MSGCVGAAGLRAAINDGDCTAPGPDMGRARGTRMAPISGAPPRRVSRARRTAKRPDSPLERPIGRRGGAHPAAIRSILSVLYRTRLACHAHHDRILHCLKLRAPGRQVGGRARAAISRRDGGAHPRVGWTIRSVEGRLTDLPEVEARSTCGARRDRWLVARDSLTTVPAESDPGRCVVWTRWPVARPTPRYPSIIPHRCASQSPPVAATPRV